MLDFFTYYVESERKVFKLKVKGHIKVNMLITAYGFIKVLIGVSNYFNSSR